MFKRFLTLTISFLLVGYFAQAQNVDDIIAKNIKARGGEKNIQDIKTIKSTMKMSMMGMEFPMTVYVKNNESTRIEMEFMGQAMITVVTPTAGWMSQGGTIQDIPAENLADARASTAQQNPLNNPLVDYKNKGTKITYEGTEKVDGKDAYKLKIVTKDTTELILFIDKETNLEFKSIVKQNMMGQEAEMEVVMKDNKYVGNVLIPHLIEMYQAGQNMGTITFDKIEVNIPIDDKLFERPQ